MTFQFDDKRVPLVARCGAARCGATRVGFTPEDTKGTTPGTQGPFYLWDHVYTAPVTWTTSKED